MGKGKEKQEHHAGDADEKAFEKMFEEAQKAGKTEPLNVQIIQWTDIGQVLIGQFKAAETLPESKFEGTVMRYLILTDTGLKSVILGSAADKEILPKLREGDLIRIEYQGQKDIGGGRTVNLFDVQRAGGSG